MKKCIVLTFVLLSNYHTYSQSKEWNDSEKINWLKQNAIKVTSVSPADTNFSDLAPLKEMFKNVNIVMLGESHGEGNIISAKIRLVKYLHEQMGFDVIAFESGFYDFHKANEDVKNGMKADTAIVNSLFGIWTGTKEFDPLLKYIMDSYAKGNKPISFCGFDDQISTGNYSLSDLTKDFEKDFAETTPLSQEDRKLFYSLIPKGMSSQNNPFGNANDSLKFYTDLSLYLNLSNKIKDKEVGSYWIQVLKCIEAVSKSNSIYRNSGVDKQWYKINNPRDEQMADNLIWLIEHNPNKKFIIWSASNHLSRNLKTLKETDDPIFFANFHPMGEYIHNKYGDKAYSIGFTAAGGTRYVKGMMSEPQEITSVLNNSIECYMQRADFNYGIINYRNLPKDNFLNQENYSNPFGYSSQKKGVWPNVLDGIFFINKIVPPNFKGGN